MIICEGSSDLVFLQYFLEKTYDWQFIKEIDYESYGQQAPIKMAPSSGCKWFRHYNGNMLCILAAGGASRIPGVLGQILDLNRLGATPPFDRTAILCDRDEIETEPIFLRSIEEKLIENHMYFDNPIEHNHWNRVNYRNMFEDELIMECLPLVLPYEENGAIETFLLDALSKASERNDEQQIDKQVIEQCIHFIDTIDCKSKYLTKRREKTKAKFNTVFVVMTPAEAYSSRQSLLRSVPWELFEEVQVGFRQLSRLSE